LASSKSKSPSKKAIPPTNPSVLNNSALWVGGKLSDFYRSALLCRAYLSLWREDEFCNIDAHTHLASPALLMARDATIRRLEIMGQALDDITKHGRPESLPVDCPGCGKSVPGTKVSIKFLKSKEAQRLAKDGIDDSYWYSVRSNISHNYQEIDHSLIWNQVFGSNLDKTLLAIEKELKNMGLSVPRLMEQSIL